MITLPQLPYEMNALEPYISEQTVKFHYTKHHQSYVTKVNALIAGTEFEGKSLEEIILKATGGIFNNGAQVWNHTFYWEGFGKNVKGEPMGELAQAINAQFGSFADFKEQFTAAAANQFGSGWAWLVVNKQGKLEIVATGNAENPLRNGQKPLLTCDVWEHAYYLDYQNDRGKFIDGFWNIVNWDIVNQRLETALKN